MDVSTLREMLGKKRPGPGSRKSAVTFAMTAKGYLQHRAFRPVGIAPRGQRQHSNRPDDEVDCVNCRQSSAGLATAACTSCLNGRAGT
jgi:hypothetical protein